MAKHYWPHRALPGPDWITGFWEPLVDDFAKVHNFTASFTALVKNHGIARLIARMPFLAGCSNPKRLAAEHLGTYLLWGHLKKYAYHQPGESIGGRIAGVCTFPDGDPDVIGAATDLLVVLSLFDHVQDQKEDSAADKFNPVTSGDIDPVQFGDVLLSRLQAAPARITQALYATLGVDIRPNESAAELFSRWATMPDCRYWWLGRTDPREIYRHDTEPIV